MVHIKYRGLNVGMQHTPVFHGSPFLFFIQNAITLPYGKHKRQSSHTFT